MGEIMIIDTIENIEKYAASFPQLRAVAAVLRSGKAETAMTGSYTTDDASVRYSVSEYQTRTKGTKGYETHRHAADVQFIVSGEEIIDICEKSCLSSQCKRTAGTSSLHTVIYEQGSPCSHVIDAQNN